MKTVHKFPLVAAEGTLGLTFNVSMPAMSQILGVEDVRDQACVYALVDVGIHAGQEQTFHMFMTGEEIPADLNLRYVGTAQRNSALGKLVYHVFQEV